MYLYSLEEWIVVEVLVILGSYSGKIWGIYGKKRIKELLEEGDVKVIRKS